MTGGWFWVEEGVVDVTHYFLFQKLNEKNKKSLGRNSIKYNYRCHGQTVLVKGSMCSAQYAY